ncbi:MAG: hypothetical protein ACM3Y9_12400, partial [Ignavibacteria bacterium]
MDWKTALGKSTPFRYPRFAAALLALFLAIVTALYWWQIETSAQRLRVETLNEGDLRARQLASGTAHLVALLFRDVDFSVRELASTVDLDDLRAL